MIPTLDQQFELDRERLVRWVRASFPGPPDPDPQSVAEMAMFYARHKARLDTIREILSPARPLF